MVLNDIQAEKLMWPIYTFLNIKRRFTHLSVRYLVILDGKNLIAGREVTVRATDEAFTY
jgi:hypothetical protein